MAKKDTFSIDWKQMIALKSFFKKAPGLFLTAQRGVLNAQAFQLKKIFIPISINKKMIVRSSKFVTSSIRVSMARGNKMQSEVGSIFRPRFSGWNEQQLGTKTKRKRLASPFSRRDSRANKIAAKRRLKKGSKVIKRGEDNVKGSSTKNKNIAWLQMLTRRNEKRPFMLENKVGKLTRGIFMLSRGRIRRIANIEPRNPQPKRIPWITSALAMQKKSDVELMWKTQINRVKKFKR